MWNWFFKGQHQGASAPDELARGTADSADDDAAPAGVGEPQEPAPSPTTGAGSAFQLTAEHRRELAQVTAEDARQMNPEQRSRMGLIAAMVREEKESAGADVDENGRPRTGSYASVASIIAGMPRQSQRKDPDLSIEAQRRLQQILAGIKSEPDVVDTKDPSHNPDVALATIGDAMKIQTSGDESKVRSAYRQVFHERRQQQRASTHVDSKGAYKVKNPAALKGRSGGTIWTEMEWKLDEVVRSEIRRSVPVMSYYTGTLKEWVENVEPQEGWDPEEEYRVMGTITVALVKTHAIGNAGIGSLSSVLDEHSHEMFEVAKFWERVEREGGKKARKSGRWINEMVNDGDEATQGSLLYVRSIHVEDDYLGTGAGLLMLHDAHECINHHMSLTLLMISPFSDDDDGETTRTEISSADQNTPEYENTLATKLKNSIEYYGLLGFRVIGDPTGQGNLYVGHWNGAPVADVDGSFFHTSSSRNAMYDVCSQNKKKSVVGSLQTYH